MSDPFRATSSKASPPPAPPLPASQPRRAGVLQRIVETVGFGGSSRPPSRAQTSSPYHISGAETEQIHGYQPPFPSQTTAHRTGIPIAALDINSGRTHAVLAGKEILKTVRFEEGVVTEDVNLRSNISSTNTVSEDIARNRRDYLPATDVKWSKGNFENFIATAANHGRIALYDVSRAEVERAWLHEHTGPVHKLAFDPHIGALLLSGSHDGSVKMWDLRTLPRASQTMKSVKGFLSRRGGVRDVKWCPTKATDALEFALCTETGVIQKWDLRKANQPVLSINAHGKDCLSLDWHPDGKHLVSGGLDKTIKVWDFYSEKGNQKPKFELRAPQAIRNIRWRPPCWSSEFAETGQWQCTQIATSYQQDDPRIHIWDFRREHLPFRELQRYVNPATDLLWADKDLIWTVGDEGWFTQTDISYAPLVHHSVSPGTVGWFPNGGYTGFMEKVGDRRDSGKEDPAVGFLSLSHHKLSSGEEMAVTNSFSDEEAGVEGLLPGTFKRRQSRAASGRSGKSQMNTPPAADGFPGVLAFDKAVPDDLFVNKQAGMVGGVTGLAADPEVVHFIAKRYTSPSSEAERMADPVSILERLEMAFNLNADVCDEVSMHRTAQSWRVLGAVIVPELRTWAEKNRAERLARLARQEETLLQQNRGEQGETLPYLESSPTERDQTKIEDQKQGKINDNHLNGLKAPDKTHALRDLDSTSNVTTPMARPLPDSPVSDISSPESRYQSLDETLEKLPQLPPSLLASHATAATAARALREAAGSMIGRQLSPSTISDSGSSRSKPKHQRAESSQSLYSLLNSPSPISRPPPHAQALLSSPLALRPTSRLPPAPRQEDRRAALRDYQKQARPLLTFDEPPSSPTPLGGIPPQAFSHGPDQSSSGQQSFPMFSTSDSSHGVLRHRSSTSSRSSSERDESSEAYNLSDGGGAASSDRGDVGRDEMEEAYRARQDKNQATGLEQRRRGNESVPDKTETQAHEHAPNLSANSASNGFRFGMDGIVENHEGKSKTNAKGRKAWDDWDEDQDAKYAQGDRPAEQTSISSSPHEPFQFDSESPVARKAAPRPQEPNVSPFLRQDTATNERAKAEPAAASTPVNLEELKSTDFIFQDFRPIDLTTYQAPTAFAWSALPLIAQAIAFDLDTGQACAQFSTHLLAHVHPYFFHQRYRSKPVVHTLAEIQKYDLTDKLMDSSLNPKIFENIFTEHDRFLKRMGLFVPMAELRKVYADFDYSDVYSDDPGAIETGLASAMPFALSISCVKSGCRAPMVDGDAICGRCKTPRQVCPICLAVHYDPGLSYDFAENAIGNGNAYHKISNDRGLWAFCQGCGHSAHLGCIEDWLAHPFSEGECATPGCGHDCGPGKARLARIAAGAIASPETKSGKSSAKGIEGDKWKVNASAAVDRTRKTLRSIDSRGTQSGDESGRVRSGFGSRNASISRTGRGSFSGQSTGQRKSVRLVTPREEIERSTGGVADALVGDGTSRSDERAVGGA